MDTTASKLDIVNLIEKNPITRLSKDYQSNLINKIKEKFTETQQQLFVSSFFCYLNYNSKTDFIILIPSFLVSELTAAFQIGFILYLPFIIIDLVVVFEVIVNFGIFIDGFVEITFDTFRVLALL